MEIYVSFRSLLARGPWSRSFCKPLVRGLCFFVSTESRQDRRNSVAKEAIVFQFASSFQSVLSSIVVRRRTFSISPCSGRTFPPVQQIPRQGTPEKRSLLRADLPPSLARVAFFRRPTRPLPRRVPRIHASFPRVGVRCPAYAPRGTADRICKGI